MRRLVDVTRPRITARESAHRSRLERRAEHVDAIALREHPADPALLDAARRAMEELYEKSEASMMDVIGRVERPPFGGDVGTSRATTNGIACSFGRSSVAGSTDDERAELLELETDDRLRVAVEAARGRLEWLDALLRTPKPT